MGISEVAAGPARRISSAKKSARTEPTIISTLEVSRPLVPSRKRSTPSARYTTTARVLALAKAPLMSDRLSGLPTIRSLGLAASRVKSRSASTLWSGLYTWMLWWCTIKDRA